MIPDELNINKIEQIYNNLSKYTIKTPLIKNSPLIDKILDTNAFFKLEFFQNGGTFKVRGAINNILNLSNNQKQIGITTVSAGNHAIAASYVASLF